jgi:hypothetical protein
MFEQSPKHIIRLSSTASPTLNLATHSRECQHCMNRGLLLLMKREFRIATGVGKIVQDYYGSISL